MIKDLLKMISQHIIFPVVYKVNCMKPINKKLVVFADAHKMKCPAHMEILRKRLIEEDYDVRDFFFDLDKVGYKKGFLLMLQFMKLYATCGHVIICDNFLPVASCKKRKKTDVIQLWHGPGAFKKFGYDAKEDIPKRYKGNVYNNYSLVTVSSKKCVDYFERAMRINRVEYPKPLHGKDIVRPIGISYTDRLFNVDYIEECKDRLRYEHPDSNGKKIVLWAPTFRGNAANGKLVGEEIVDRLAKDGSICNDFYIIKSIHPHIKSGEKTQSDFGMKTDELIACADILITDYSSVFFEYLIMDKPIIFFAPDYSEYSEKRGFYLLYDGLPGYIIRDDEKDEEVLKNKLSCAIRDAAYGDDSTMSRRRKKYREVYMSECDGNVTDRIITYMREFYNN